jgi:hypothetical protein
MGCSTLKNNKTMSPILQRNYNPVSKTVFQMREILTRRPHGEIKK